MSIESTIVHCEECGQASGFTGESPTHLVLGHSDTCLYNVEEDNDHRSDSYV